MVIVTCIAPVNIAVIKYWGKRCEDLILPINDSLSATLSTDQMCAKTTIVATPELTENKFWLNGHEMSFDDKRLQNCLNQVRRIAESQSNPIAKWNIHICSENNFPTAAGLASSAAGFACLVYTLAQLYNIRGDISAIARLGSGSACRSVYGGWVRWLQGIDPLGSDSIARQVAPAQHWPDMRVLILVVNETKKKVASTVGMQTSVETSDLLKFRASNCVPERIERMVEAINLRDFETFGRITMQDSNQFHAVCLDTFPPCVYMNDTSHAISRFVHAYNESHSCIKAAYTFDAGPNACIYLKQNVVNDFVSNLLACFPTTNADFIRGLPVDVQTANQRLIDVQNSNLIRYIIHTSVGDGPRVLSEPSDHLLDEHGHVKVVE